MKRKTVIRIVFVCAMLLLFSIHPTGALFGMVISLYLEKWQKEDDE